MKWRQEQLDVVATRMMPRMMAEELTHCLPYAPIFSFYTSISAGFPEALVQRDRYLPHPESILSSSITIPFSPLRPRLDATPYNVKGSVPRPVAAIVQASPP